MQPGTQTGVCRSTSAIFLTTSGDTQPRRWQSMRLCTRPASRGSPGDGVWREFGRLQPAACPVGVHGGRCEIPDIRSIAGLPLTLEVSMVVLGILLGLVGLGLIAFASRARVIHQYEKGVVFRLGRVQTPPRSAGLTRII